MRSGFVSIVGRPNVGKSTLLNKIVGEKVAIISDKQGTTRSLVQGIYNEEDTQIVFIDTPGISKPLNKLGNKLNSQAYYSTYDADALVLVMDAKEKLGKGDMFVLDKMKSLEKPVILVINKIDKLSNEEILKKIDELKDLYPFSDIVPVSAETGDNVKRLIEVLKKYLTCDVKYYPKEEKTSEPIEKRLAEIVREKVLNLTHEEVPHAVTCVLEKYEEEKNSIHINVLIIVEREGIKRILVGHSGSMIKEIGIEARKDIEELVGKKVYLELFVKTVNNWREKDKYLTEFGFNNE